MKRFFISLSVVLMISNISIAQKPIEVPLWAKGSPESNGINEAEITENNFFVRNISEGRMFIYHPEEKNNTGAAVIICPGGGYAGEAIYHEGHDFAKWFVEKGITAVVLKYRLPNKNHFIPLKDAQRALQTVRHHAKEWEINPLKIGIAGFSAGGHLASTAGTHFSSGNPSAADPIERVSNRPDFMILFYPVITMKEEFTHMGSRNNLIGNGDDARLVKLYSNEEQVTAETPPTILILSDDDEAVMPRNSIEFYSALKQYQIPAALYIIPSGGHGWGTHPKKEQFKEWSIPLNDWLFKTIVKQ